MRCVLMDKNTIVLTLGVAELQQLIGPVASVDSFVVDQAGLTRSLMGGSVFAFQEAGGALVAVRVDSESELASRRGEGNLVVFAGSAFNGPVVVAVVVHVSFAIEKQAVLALLKGQCT